MWGSPRGGFLEPFRYQVRIRGEYACFTRPEFKTERVSYEVITPSAARGVLEAILWKPAIRWHVKRIFLLARPRFIQFKRNEVRERAKVDSALKAMRSGEALDYFTDDDRAQRNTLALRDVDYAVETEFRMTARQGPEDNPKKFDEMFCNESRSFPAPRSRHFPPRFSHSYLPLQVTFARGALKPG